MSTENTNNLPAETPAVQKLKKDISAQVLAKVEDFQSAGELTLPQDYNVGNALKSAYILLTDPKENLLEKCTAASVADALLKMVVYGVSPIKKQCYFIKYGDKLECSISYAGNIVTAKRYAGLAWIKANAIFEGDVFEFQVDVETGHRKILKHLQTLDSIGSGKLKGAYAVYALTDGTIDAEVMHIEQIKAAWGQGGAKGNSPAHNKFPDQMAAKTVINRACKLLISSSDDAILSNPLDDDENPESTTKADVNHEVKTKGNKKQLDFNSMNVQDAEIVHPEATDPELIAKSVPAEKNSAVEGPNF